MTTNLQKQWRVEWRKDRKSPWVKAGLFETKAGAKTSAFNEYRVGKAVGPYNTRVTVYTKEKA